MDKVEEEYPDFDAGSEYRSVTKKDQLTYRTTIQKFVEYSLFTKTSYGTFDRYVKALRSALYFQIPGLPFQERMDEYKKEIEEEIEKFKQQKILECDNGMYYHPKVWSDLSFKDKSILKQDIYFARWGNWLAFLLDILAEHDALMKAKGYVEEGTESVPKLKQQF